MNNHVLIFCVSTIIGWMIVLIAFELSDSNSPKIYYDKQSAIEHTNELNPIWIMENKEIRGNMSHYIVSNMYDKHFVMWSTIHDYQIGFKITY